MFENCTIKYNYNGQNEKTSIQVIYPNNSDGSRKELSIPLKEDNSDYQMVMEWVAEGNTITDNGGGE